jgi:YidC/Oxa1 family membrane protein insertase
LNVTLAARFLEIEWLNNALVQFFGIIHSGVQVVFANDNLSYGITIILVTLIIRGLLFPLNYKQLKSSSKMNEIQPKIKELQTKYKNNPEKLNQETMKLYKEEGVNPLGGCLPLLLQWPILIAMYYLFMNLTIINPNIGDVTFLGLKLLGTPASFSEVSSNILLLGTWILPLLSGATTYFSSIIMAPKGSDASKQTGTLSIGMSIMITYMSFRFTTALVLYWVTNNLFQLVQSLLIKRGNNKKVQEA